ncbi:MAG: PfkB family carbohydrate kinase [Phycisphaerales bacterium]
MEAKILSHADLLALCEDARREGRSVVHCHGCFDIVHPGHIRHLRYAKALGDILLVSITGDAEMKKGTGRPLIPEELRAENLAALDCVDWVYVESRPTAAELLAEVRPDVYVKGREYESNKDPRFQAERHAVESGGGRVVFSSGDVVFSSTALISAIETSIDPFHARLAQLSASPSLQGPDLFSLISSFRGKRVLVIGETILDTYVFCDRPEVAGESPVMTLRPLERRHYDGGAAIIARHVAALGARPVLVTAMPVDAQGESVRRRLVAEGVEVRPLVVDRPLCEKQRFLVGTQKIMKLDLVERLVLDAAQQDRLVGIAAESARDCNCHAAIIADFGQGLFSPITLRRLCRELRPLVQTLAGDVSGRRSHLRSMTDMDLLCPSESELRESFGLTDRGLPAVAWELLEETKSKAALVTMGPEGAIAFDRLPDSADEREDRFRTRLRAEHLPALAPIAIDPLGCGDSLITVATLALASGSSLLAAAFLGSIAAAVQAQRLGNLPVSSTDLRQGVARVHNAHLTFAAADVVSAKQSLASIARAV